MTLDIDPLKLYLGEDYVINDRIVIHQPKIGEVIGFGEKEFFALIHTITAIPSDMKSRLWDSGINWMEIKDYELFQILAPSLQPEDTRLIFGDDVDFRGLRPHKNTQNDTIVMFDPDTGLLIDELIYIRIVNYLRLMCGIKPKVEKAFNKTTRDVMIQIDRDDIAFQKTQPYKSFLFPLISAVKVRTGYTLEYIKNEGYVEFMNDVKRLQLIVESDHLMNGVYSGMLDTKKIDLKKYDWMKEL